MGGLGKTTLAQMTFNDVRVKNHFEPKIWVYVSRDFDVKRVIQEAIKSVSGKASEASDLDSLQGGLRDILNGKMYMIVLDDVWNENQVKWDLLKCVLACGSKGASVIITTRHEKVSSIMRTNIPPLRLSLLSEDDCWLLFRQRAFGHENQERQNLVPIGKEIVKKCGGVPLAAKALGGLLRFKDKESEWISIKESEIWNLPCGEDEDSILPALRLSYYNLSPELRRCFSYCAVFPKGCEIEKETLIHLWMANGYITYNGKSELEDIGEHTWNELCWRSFFQDVRKDYLSNILFKMHDLMHDLAQSVMKDECHIMENESSSRISNHTMHHVTLLGDYEDSIVFPESLQSVKSLRSILLQSRYRIRIFKGNQFFCEFTKFPLLRAFSAKGANMLQLSSSIGNLKHLRFVNLSRTPVQTLPESICSLHNLQTLNLNDCNELRSLPEKFKNLRSLRHLYLKKCPKIQDMPPKLGQLTHLKTLSLFCVGESGDRQLTELKHLDLGGELRIKHLERVRNLMDAKGANLVGKQNLRILKLEWSPNSDWESQANVEPLLEALRPHHNVEELFIEHYKGAQFPLWMRDSTLKNVVTIDLSNCRNCSLLPPFCRLPSLRRLGISRMDHVEYIDNDFPGGGPVQGFPSLEKLKIRDLPNLKGLSREEGRDLFPRLGHIYVENCPKLTSLHLSSSEILTMYIIGCSKGMLSSISNLNCLTQLTVAENDDAISFPEEMLQNLTSLEYLTITAFSKLKVLPGNLSRLVSLKSLDIDRCHELESLPEHGLRSLKSLVRLWIYGCNNFSSLSESLGHLNALEALYVSYCPRLVAIPESIKHLGTLRHLTFTGDVTSELKALPEALQHLTSLESLSIASYPELTSLPEWLGNFSSLQWLEIGNCPKIQSLPQSIQSLTKLKTLTIRGCCPELARRCQKGNGEDWHKIAHIQTFDLD